MPKLTKTPHWGRGGVCVKYHPHVVFSFRSYPILSSFMTPNFAHVPKLNRRTDFYAVCFYDVNSRLLHTYRHKNSESFHLPLFLPKLEYLAVYGRNSIAAFRQLFVSICWD